jgi:phosphatidylinositol alpha-1,6-mannosyltransferase
LIASNFPPVLGGSASVYGNLASCAPDQVMVLAPSRDYLTGAAIPGHEAHDRDAAFRVFRIPLLRTVMQQGRLHGAGRLLFILSDILIRLRVLGRVLSLILFHRVRTVCLGELLSFGWLIGMLRWLPGISTAVYVHGEEITTSDSYDPSHSRARRAILDSDVTIVVSSFTMQAVHELLGPHHGKRITMIQNGVNKQAFFLGEKAPALVARYGLEGCFTFVSVCRLVPKKGIDNAIKAFRSISDAKPDARFLVVGSGQDEHRLRQIVSEQDLSGKVIFAGRVPDPELADHYRLGDVFVMPNRRMPDGDTEGFGLVFLEANRCGLPVVAGRDGGSTDAVQDGLNGLVVNGHSVPAIAAAMRALTEDEALYQRLREGGLLVSERAGWDEKARAFLRVILRRGGNGDRVQAAPTTGQFTLVWLFCLPLVLLALPYLLILRITGPARASNA